jgi:hypothetical protein
MAGAENVTTVEVDPGLAEHARRRLADAGISLTVIIGDGAAGYRRNALYDRVIATATVRRIPPAWVAQTRPGGIILTPWGTAFDPGALLRLTVDADGTASGPFVDNTIAFMWLRRQRVDRAAPPERVDGAAESVTDLHPDMVAWDDYNARLSLPPSMWSWTRTHDARLGSTPSVASLPVTRRGPEGHGLLFPGGDGTLGSREIEMRSKGSSLRMILPFLHDHRSTVGVGGP